MKKQYLTVLTSFFMVGLVTEIQAQETVASNLPDAITIAALPEVTQNTGSGSVWESALAQWPGYDMAHFGYEANEYVISGIADGQPYKTRLVIRQPADDSKFSGLVVAEAMHPAGQAHAFQYNSVYLMDSGHIAVEITTQGLEQIVSSNAERYGGFQVSNNQVSEVLAQAGALIKSAQSPIADLNLRKMVLWGTSASSGILVRYLPAHKVFKTVSMENIYDGFMPTSNGSTIETVDVPMIQVPTQHEYRNIATAVQDSDEPGRQFRSYEFVGIGHLMARNNDRLSEGSCVNPITTFPLEAYMSVALHHLFEWVDKGISPPHGGRVLIDRDMANDGSLMALDSNGNALGGIRNPYVDIPVTKYTAGNNGEAGILCILSVWEMPFSEEKLRDLYGNKENYVRLFEQSLSQQEEDGWALPVFHELIMPDARAVNF